MINFANNIATGLTRPGNDSLIPDREEEEAALAASVYTLMISEGTNSSSPLPDGGI